MGGKLIPTLGLLPSKILTISVWVAAVSAWPTFLELTNLHLSCKLESKLTCQHQQCSPGPFQERIYLRPLPAWASVSSLRCGVKIDGCRTSFLC